jgi:predicted GNAT family N-acyltransferase
MAVLAPWRGRGIGQALLGQMIGQARLRGDREVLLNAQTAALGFYAKLGFQAFGEIFLDAGIPHRAMRLRLG